MRTQYILFFVFLIISAASPAQQIAPSVISAAGEHEAGNEYQVSWTLGEPIIQTVSNGKYVLTQGFHQGTIEISSGIETKSDPFGITIYPNPVNEQLFIQFERKPHLIQIEIFDMAGQKLISRDINTSGQSVNLHELSAGTYILKIQSDNYFETYKILKQ